jgi:uncharacterized protein (DUF58 family)
MKSPFKKRDRIYIFPNRFGFLGFALFLVMLAGGATYQNNLVFMMAFLIISLSLVAILQTARNLRDLEILSLNVDSNFAGQSTTARLSLTNGSTDPKINLEIIAEYIGENKSKLKFKTTFLATSLETSSTATFKSTLNLPTKRGEYKLRRLRVGTSAPYGLFGSWIYLPCKSNFVVYPEPLGTRQLPTTTHAMGEDFSGHKNYVVGDSMNRIDWKIFSRHRELFVKEYLDGANPRLEFTYNDQSENAVEQQLSQLSLWLSMAREKNYDFKLKMPHFQTDFACDTNHYMRCMREISTWAA